MSMKAVYEAAQEAQHFCDRLSEMGVTPEDILESDRLAQEFIDAGLDVTKLTDVSFFSKNYHGISRI